MYTLKVVKCKPILFLLFYRKFLLSYNSITTWSSLACNINKYLKLWKLSFMQRKTNTSNLHCIYRYLQNFNTTLKFIERKKKMTLEIFGPRTWCHKNHSVIEPHTSWIQFNVSSKTRCVSENYYKKVLLSLYFPLNITPLTSTGLFVFCLCSKLFSKNSRSLADVTLVNQDKHDVLMT